MKSAPHHPQEVQRIEALRHYEVLDTEAEKAFDDLAFLTSQILRTPIALVSLVDEGRQWFKARVGLEATETPREVAFCAHALLEDEPLVVPNATKDARFVDNPLVTAEPHIRFYAGAQLKSAEGLPLGTLCAIDTEPRELSAGQIRALEILARQVVCQLETRLALRKVREYQDLSDGQAANRTRMLRALAHDLRSPLGGLLGLAELLATDIDTLSTEEVRGLLRDLSLSAYSLQGLVDNILAWSLIDNGGGAPTTTRISLEETCQQVTATLDVALRNKRVGLGRAVPAGLTLEADPMMLRSILQNLLTNAIKFTPSGGEVELKASARDGAVVIEVSDSGLGMSAREVGALNRGEAIGSKHGTAGELGSGLGYTIVRDFVAAHEGQLEVRAIEGRGTTVEVRLPQRRR